MPPSKVKKSRKAKKKSCPEEITDEERLETLGIYRDKEDEN